MGVGGVKNNSLKKNIPLLCCKENDLETSPEKEILGDGDVATVAHEKEKYVMDNKTLKQKEWSLQTF